jgi:hypothetical protein
LRLVFTIAANGIKTFREGWFAVPTEVALTSIGHFVRFVSCGITAEPTFYCFSPRIIPYFTVPLGLMIAVVIDRN